jgi:hypothetical protein
LKARQAKRDQGFDGPARVTAVSVNLKLGVQGVGLNLCKSSLGAAYWARASCSSGKQSRTSVQTVTGRSLPGPLDAVRVAAIRHRCGKPPAHTELALRLPQQQQTRIGRLGAAVKNQL